MTIRQFNKVHHPCNCVIFLLQKELLYFFLLRHTQTPTLGNECGINCQFYH